MLCDQRMEAVSVRGRQPGTYQTTRVQGVYNMVACLMIFLISLALWMTLWASTADAVSPVEVQEFELMTLEGERSSKALQLGHSTFLAFLAPWCHVCRWEWPNLFELSQKSRPKQRPILNIAFTETPANVEEPVEASPKVVVFPTACDVKGRDVQPCGVSTDQIFVVIDEGVPIFVNFGARLD
ncbi:MAG: thioredoxin family protein [Nitrospirales bacterium]|nr:thioredoxin family protein [Nitrospirales bacterium]